MAATRARAGARGVSITRSVSTAGECDSEISPCSGAVCGCAASGGADVLAREYSGAMLTAPTATPNTNIPTARGSRSTGRAAAVSVAITSGRMLIVLPSRRDRESTDTRIAPQVYATLIQCDCEARQCDCA